MPTYISLLRAINVSGKNKIIMAELQHLYISLQCKNVTTYIQSGNIIFTHPSLNKEQLQTIITGAINKKFHLKIQGIIITIEELNQIIRESPFKKEDQTKVYVTILQTTPSEIISEENLINIKSPTEKIIIKNHHIYLFCPDGYGKTKLTPKFFEKKLNTTTTTRNWNTITTLYQLAKS